jgi:hypothetical protein
MKHLQFLLLSLSSIPFLLQAQEKTKHAFGDRLLLGAHYGFYEDYVDTRDNQYEVAHFVGMRAGVLMAKHLYAGIQTRLIWARNFETPTQNFYMAGVWARGYLLHPVLEKSTKRLGVFLETGFMLGNYAFENLNAVEYHFEQPGSWYVPNMLGRRVPGVAQIDPGRRDEPDFQQWRRVGPARHCLFEFGSQLALVSPRWGKRMKSLRFKV